MIGRAAMHNPKIFEQCLQNSDVQVTDEERWQWINEFYTLAIEHDFFRLIRFRKRISDFLHPLLTIEQRKYLRNEKLKLSLEEITHFLQQTFEKRINFLQMDR